MTPYAGLEVWMYFVFAILIIAAIALLATAFRIEKIEKAQEDTAVRASVRKKKYGAFAGFAVVLAGIAVLIFAGESISQKNYQSQIIDHIESHGVTVTEGFVDPSIPLRADSQAKFVVQSEAGLVRCRANAGGANEEIEFICQDAVDEDKEFTIPLSEVNEMETPEPTKEQAEAEEDEK